MATLLLSQGVPMILAGDELGHTQNGNNNAYCQDNELSWLDWELDAQEIDFFDFVHELIQLRKQNPVFHRRRFFQGRPIRGGEIKDIYWLDPDGKEMGDDDWSTGYIRCLGMGLVGGRIDERDEFGKLVRGKTFLLLINAHHESIPFSLSVGDEPLPWRRVLDTADPRNEKPWPEAEGQAYPLEGRSIVVLQLAQKGPLGQRRQDEGESQSDLLDARRAKAKGTATA
jgi:glycogen operon protein